jgi:TMEM175 potassium channel family protein
MQPGVTLLDSETGRVEAFSDGVFAIAITLLILEIKIPKPADGPLAWQLLKQWPSYFAFLISFAFIGVMWINHHRLFTHIKRCDDVLLVLNLLLLLGVTVVPFPTAVLASHIRNPGQRTAALLYNGVYVFIAIVFNLLWRYAVSRNHHLLGKQVDREGVRRISKQYAFGPLCYLLCAAIAWFPPAWWRIFSLRSFSPCLPNTPPGLSGAREATAKPGQQKKSEEQIPRGLRPARNDKCKGGGGAEFRPNANVRPGFLPSSYARPEGRVRPRGHCSMQMFIAFASRRPMATLQKLDA